jgi:hypothetical protein
MLCPDLLCPPICSARLRDDAAGWLILQMLHCNTSFIWARSKPRQAEICATQQKSGNANKVQ